ncbi:MAG: hypothetical protein AAGI23_12520 [Bacteroidota bacterium]
MSTIFHSYTDKQLSILRAIGKYKFLCYPQMIRLGIDKYTSNLSTAMKSLVEGRHPLVKKIPHRTGTAAIFYLTKRGKEMLLDLRVAAANIHLPKGAVLSATQDTIHRTHLIDIQIELDLACKEKSIEVLFCDRYFDTVGNARDKSLASKTAILFEQNKTFKSDMIFMLQIEKQKELYLLELEMGKNSKKSAIKVMENAKAILKGSANQKYQYQKAYRTLWILEHQSILDATITRVQDDVFFANLNEYFLFKSLEQISNTDFFEQWCNLAVVKRKLYY